MTPSKSKHPTFYLFVAKLIRDLTNNIELGMRPDLAAAFAIAELKLTSFAKKPPVPLVPFDRHQVRVVQAVQLAVAYYDGEEAIEALGDARAKELRQEFLDLLIDLGGN